MAKPTSILGSVETKEIKLGAGRIFRGGSAATFAGTSKFDSNSLGSGTSAWEDLRCMATDAAVAATANMYKYVNGVPTTLKKSVITGRETTLTAKFDEFKSRILQTALGLTSPINKLAATLMTVQASPSPTSTVFTMDTVSGLAAGDEIVIEALSGSLAASSNSGLVDSIAGAAITLREALRDGAPTSTWVAKKRIATKLPFGGSQVSTYPLLFVVDFVVDKKQFVAFFPKVSVAGSFNPNMGGGTTHADTPITWDCYGVYDSDLDDNMLAAFYILEDES